MLNSGYDATEHIHRIALIRMIRFQCIDAGIAVVVDKPLATDARQALEVVEAARAAT